MKDFYILEKRSFVILNIAIMLSLFHVVLFPLFPLRREIVLNRKIIPLNELLIQSRLFSIREAT